MGNKVNNQRQILPNQEAKPIGNAGNVNKPQSRQTLGGGIGSRGNVNGQKQNTKPMNVRSNGGKGLNSQSNNLQPQTARSNGGKGLNTQKQTMQGATPFATNNNVNSQKNDFPDNRSVKETGFEY